MDKTRKYDGCMQWLLVYILNNIRWIWQLFGFFWSLFLNIMAFISWWKKKTTLKQLKIRDKRCGPPFLSICFNNSMKQTIAFGWNILFQKSVTFWSFFSYAASFLVSNHNTYLSFVNGDVMWHNWYY